MIFAVCLNSLANILLGYRHKKINEKYAVTGGSWSSLLVSAFGTFCSVTK